MPTHILVVAVLLIGVLALFHRSLRYHLARFWQLLFIRIMICRLDPQEKCVIEMRYGVGVNDPKHMTLSEIGERLNLTRERVRMVEMGALAKLRRWAGTEATP